MEFVGCNIYAALVGLESAVCIMFYS